MPTVNFYTRKEPNRKDEVLIYLYLRYDNKTVKVSTGEYAQWDKKNKRAKRFDSKLAAQLVELERKARRIFREAVVDESAPDQQTLAARIKAEFNLKGCANQKTSLFSFIEKFIAEAKENGKNKGTVGAYENAYVHLKEFEKHSGIQLDFDNIDAEKFEKLKTYYRKEKKLSPNTIAKQTTILKIFLNAATERKINSNLAFRGKSFQAVTVESESVYLTPAEIDAIAAVDLSKSQKLTRVRDLFLIGCCTGLRFSDLSRLTKENFHKDGSGEFIQIVQKKTGAAVVAPIFSHAATVLERYKGTGQRVPKAMSAQKMNDYLKEIGRLAGLTEEVSITKHIKGVETTVKRPKCELISSHTARRSFATNAIEMGVPMHTVMAVTGHKTERAFRKYIKTDKKTSAIILRQYMDAPRLKVVS